VNNPFSHRTRRRAPHVNITSLIDVLFLLLIFFMVSSTFRDDFGIDVTLPAASTAEATETPPLTITVREDGGFFFEGRPMDAPALRAALAERLLDDRDAAIDLRADRAAPFEFVVQAIDVARQAGGRQLRLPTQYETEAGADGPDTGPAP
jgi:biopolymer transport protein ExbD